MAHFTTRVFCLILCLIEAKRQLNLNRALHITFTVLLFLAAVVEAEAARRLAFVVGINDYQHIPKLEKAVGDAKAMSAKLTDLGFEVTSVLNPTRRNLNLAVADFTAKLKRDDLVFLHFSGHGVEIDGDNILLPVDVPKPKSGRKYAVVSEGVGLRRLIDLISSTGARTRVFVIDACRDNPFEQTGVRSIGFKSRFGEDYCTVGHVYHVLSWISPNCSGSP